MDTTTITSAEQTRLPRGGSQPRPKWTEVCFGLGRPPFGGWIALSTDVVFRTISWGLWIVRGTHDPTPQATRRRRSAAEDTEKRNFQDVRVVLERLTFESSETQTVQKLVQIALYVAVRSANESLYTFPHVRGSERPRGDRTRNTQ